MVRGDKSGDHGLEQANPRPFHMAMISGPVTAGTVTAHRSLLYEQDHSDYRHHAPCIGGQHRNRGKRLTWRRTRRSWRRQLDRAKQARMRAFTPSTSETTPATHAARHGRFLRCRTVPGPRTARPPGSWCPVRRDFVWAGHKPQPHRAVRNPGPGTRPLAAARARNSDCAVKLHPVQHIWPRNEPTTSAWLRHPPHVGSSVKPAVVALRVLRRSAVA